MQSKIDKFIMIYANIYVIYITYIYMCVCVCVCYLLVDIGNIEKNPPLWASVLGKDAKSNLKSYPWQKQDY